MSRIRFTTSLFSLAWQEGLAYRASVLVWRLRTILTLVFSLTIWQVAFTSGASQLSYNRDSMIVYILLTAFLQGIVVATALQGLTQTIYSGQLSALLIKPLSLFRYFFIIDLADKLKNTLFALLEALFFLWLLRPLLVLPSLSTLALLLGWTAGALLLNFCLSLLLGAIGFWSPDAWGPRFLFYTLIGFVGGTVFPLDLMPTLVQRLLFLTPLPYYSFIQTQLFLGRLTGDEMLHYSLGLLSWLIIFALLTRLVWQKGLRNYDASGQ